MSTNQPNSQSLDALAVGRTGSDPFITYFSTRDPTSNDVNYPVQKRWFNTALDNEWILVNYTNSSGQLLANWQPVSHSSAVTETLTGNSGGPVAVDGANNINVVGDATTINIVGVPGTHTLTASTTGSIATTYTEQSGTASPIAGNLIINGQDVLTTTGSGNTVTIATTLATDGQLMIGSTAAPHARLGTLTSLGSTIAITNGSGTINLETGSAVATSYVENSGTAIPLAGVLNILGSAGITTSGAGDTVTVTAGPTIATLYTEDSGTATPFLNNLNILGGTGISTSGAGSTVTITNTLESTGSWTPTLFGSTVSGTTTYLLQVGKYVKIGSFVYVWGQISITAATGTGNATIGGLPFTAGAFTTNYDGFLLGSGGWSWPAGTTSVLCYASPASTNLSLDAQGSAVSHALIQMQNAAYTFQFAVGYSTI